MVQIPLDKVRNSLVAIATAVILGLIVDKTFEKYFSDKPKFARILFQFIVIALIIAIINANSERYLKLDLVNNIFFISVFLGVQQNLFMTVSGVGM